MSRILKYRESLNKFIKDKSCLVDDKTLDAVNLKNNIIDCVKKSSFRFSILLLTTMNNQNKKNHVTMQGYYAATSIELINVYISYKEDCKNMIKNDGYDLYYGSLNTISNYCLKSVTQNLDSIKNHLSPGNIMNVATNSINTYINTINIINKNQANQMTSNDKVAHKDVIKWYLKDDQSLVTKFNQIKQLTKESLNDYIDKKYTIVCEMALTLGWIMGGGDIKEINKLKKPAKSFAIMIKISDDFINIEKDIRNPLGNMTYNYIINYGLQESYEQFMVNKEKFIQDAMVMDLFTSTIKELIDEIEANVDEIIDQTSPDIKSSYSSVSKN